MPDVVGWRSKFAVIVPSTNTVVEHDVWEVRPPGISFHTGRMYISEPSLDSDSDFLALLDQIRSSISDAITNVMTAKPDYLMMGMSAETFWGGVKGNQSFMERVSAQAGGLPVTTGASACRAGLEALGVKRIAVFSPYQVVADVEVGNYFTEAGFDVVKITGLRCPSATAIAEVGEDRIRKMLIEIDSPDVDAIVQVGTNLSFLRLADEAERWLSKPILAINAVTLWHALRACGFDDKFQGFGVLLREF